MKAKDLSERATTDLVELREQMRKDLFSYRMKNHLGQLEDTSLIPKHRRDIARVEGILTARKLSDAAAASSSKTNMNAKASTERSAS